MDINRNGIVGRAFLVAHRLTRQFVGDPDPDSPWRTDLCSFLRTVLIWAPLAIAFNLATVAWAVYALGYFGYVMWLNLTWFTTVISFIVAVAAAGMAGTAATYGSLRLVRRMARSEVVHEFGEVVAAHYCAQKARICPFIDIVEPRP